MVIFLQDHYNETTDDKIITLIYLVVFKLGVEGGGGGGKKFQNSSRYKRHNNKNKNYYKPPVPPGTYQDPRATVFEVTCHVISVALLTKY